MIRRLLLACLPCLAVAGDAHAQLSADHIFRPGAISASVFAGGAAFSPFLRGTARPESGSTLEFQRRVSAHTTAAVGAELLVWLHERIGVRAHASYMPTRFDVTHDAAGTAFLRERLGNTDSLSLRALDVWLADISAVVRPPISFGRFAPYAILGVGAASYRAHGREELPPEANESFASGHRTLPAAVVGVGGAIPLQRRRLVLSFALTDHVTRTPVTDPQSGTSLHEGDVTMLLGGAREEGSDGVSLTSNVRLLVGLTLPLAAGR